jgi:hypothetical protein
MTLDPEFEFGDTVWNTAGNYDDDFRMMGVVIGYEVLPGPTIRYDVRWADNTLCTHYGFELTHKRYTSDEGLEN